MTAHVGTPDGRDRLPEEVVVCPNTKTADANAKIVDKTLMMIFFGFLRSKVLLTVKNQNQRGVEWYI